MTRLRKLAVKISDTVVRRSPPAYKDWAQATSRELEFIESDWAALRWALGSWKMAARCQPAPLTSLSEVPRAAQKFLRETRVSTVVTWLNLLWMSSWFSGVFRYAVGGRQTGLGWGLNLAALGYIACEAIAFRGWRSPREGGLPEVADAYRAALVHQREVLSGAWYWSRATLILAGPLLGAYHAWLLKPGAAREAIFYANLRACGIIVLALVAARLLTWRIVVRYQGTIDQLDALQGDGR
jgi:hypothetical protein